LIDPDEDIVFSDDEPDNDADNEPDNKPDNGILRPGKPNEA
jgi:hypothetical protein